jgi:DNA-binding CsgD family transcriptional regulator
VRALQPLRLLEAAYRLDGSDGDWMRELVETLANVFAREGLGSMGFLMSAQVNSAGRTMLWEIREPCETGHVTPRDLHEVLGQYRDLPLDLQERLFFSSIADTVSQATGLGERLPDYPFWQNHGGWNTSIVGDAFGLRCHDGPLHGVVFGAGLRDVTTPTVGELRIWQRLAMHIGAAARLRRGQAFKPQDADAVLSPAGNVHHLVRNGDGRAVKEGFKRRQYARRRHTTPEAALDIWRGLHDGRWSLVDHIDTDGKAFVLAVRNEPAREVASSLTDRQRAAVALAALGYGNKQIAYALGLTATAVAMLLARARTATGVRTRAELVRSFKRSLVAPA